ncbi:MAG: hypothetical protein FWB71_01420, partial [Defluviitaleaceae bacterium]|nr:hypothetical protein [Defluviitaleaceae bacterium]
EDVLDEVKGLTRALGEMTEMVKACLEKPQAEDGTQKAGFKIGADVDKSETDLNRIASIFGNV